MFFINNCQFILSIYTYIYKMHKTSNYILPVLHVLCIPLYLILDQARLLHLILFSQRIRSVVDILLEIDDLMIIRFIHQFRLDHKVRCGFIVRHRYIVYLGDTEQSLHIRIVWCRCCNPLPGRRCLPPLSPKKVPGTHFCVRGRCFNLCLS